MATLDRKQAHLAMIQTIVRRMALGALLLEGWSLLVVAALLTAAHDPQRSGANWQSEPNSCALY